MPANNPLGYSFAPGTESVGMSKPAQPSLQPPSAIEYRNLRIPHRQVPGQLAPQALLQGRGGQGVPDVQLLRQLMQAFAPQGAQPGVPMLQGAPQTSHAMDRVGFPQSPMTAAPPQAPSGPLPSASGNVRVGAGGVPPFGETDPAPAAPVPTAPEGQWVPYPQDSPNSELFLTNEELQRRLTETLSQVPAMPFSY